MEVIELRETIIEQVWNEFQGAVSSANCWNGEKQWENHGISWAEGDMMEIQESTPINSDRQYLHAKKIPEMVIIGVPLYFHLLIGFIYIYIYICIYNI